MLVDKHHVTVESKTLLVLEISKQRIVLTDLVSVLSIMINGKLLEISLPLHSAKYALWMRRILRGSQERK